MSDLISRQAAIDALKQDRCAIDRLVQKSCGDKVYVAQVSQVECDIYAIEMLPSAQPKSENEPSKTVHFVPNEDFISRKTAIDAINAVFPVDPNKSEYASGIACGAALALTYIKQLPSAQPQQLKIIRCGECKHYVDGYIHCNRVTWYNSENDFCSRAERRTDG